MGQKCSTSIDHSQAQEFKKQLRIDNHGSIERQQTKDTTQIVQNNQEFLTTPMLTNKFIQMSVDGGEIKYSSARNQSESSGRRMNNLQSFGSGQSPIRQEYKQQRNLSQVASRQPPQSASQIEAVQLNKTAEKYIVKGQYDKALSYLDEANQSDSDNYLILNNIGLCYLNLGRYDEALIFFTSSIKANYEFPRSLNNLGNTMRKKNEIARAIGCYEQAIKTHNCLMQTGKFNERFHIAHLNLSTAYIESNNVLSAIENLQYAYENNHKTIIQASREKGLDYLVEHDQIIYAIATIESKEYAEGIEMIEQIGNYIDIEQNPVLCYYMALCKMRKTQLQESLNYCERVKQLLEIHPRKLVCRLYSERIQLVLEQIELIEQEQLRQQMQSSQANQDLTQEDEEDDKPIYVQLSLKNYNKNSNSLEKKKRQTEQFQRAYLRAASSQQKSDQNTNSSININHRHQESIGSNMNMSIFKIADNSSLRINANHPILNSPQLSSRGGRAFTPLKERITQSFINIQNKIQQTFSNATGQQILQQADIMKSQQIATQDSTKQLIKITEKQLIIKCQKLGWFIKHPTTNFTKEL
eukprot:403344475